VKDLAISTAEGKRTGKNHEIEFPGIRFEVARGQPLTQDFRFFDVEYQLNE